MQVFMYQVFCRSWGFDTIAIVASSREKADKQLAKEYPHEQKGNITFVGFVPCKAGQSVVCSFQE